LLYRLKYNKFKREGEKHQITSEGIIIKTIWCVCLCFEI